MKKIIAFTLGVLSVGGGGLEASITVKNECSGRQKFFRNSYMDSAGFASDGVWINSKRKGVLPAIKGKKYSVFWTAVGQAVSPMGKYSCENVKDGDTVTFKDSKEKIIGAYACVCHK